MKRNHIHIRMLILTFVTVILFSGCAPENRPAEGVIAYVNGDPIYLKEVKKLLAIRARQKPAFKVNESSLNDIIDTLVDKKLIIQEAMKKGMAEEERFVNTIKDFWEQTLVRDFYDYKKEEFANYIFVTDEEIKEYYNDLKINRDIELPPLKDIRSEIKMRITNEKLLSLFNNWLEEKRKKSKIKINKNLLLAEFLEK